MYPYVYLICQIAVEFAFRLVKAVKATKPSSSAVFSFVLCNHAESVSIKDLAKRMHFVSA